MSLITFTQRYDHTITLIKRKKKIISTFLELNGSLSVKKQKAKQTENTWVPTTQVRFKFRNCIFAISIIISLWKKGLLYPRMGFAKFGWNCLCNTWGEDENVKGTYYYDVMTIKCTQGLISGYKQITYFYILLQFWQIDRFTVRIVVEIVSLEGV